MEMVLYIELHPYYMAYALHVDASSFMIIVTGSFCVILFIRICLEPALTLSYFFSCFESPFGAHILLIIISINIHPNHTTIIWKMRQIARFVRISYPFLSILLMYVCVCVLILCAKDRKKCESDTAWWWWWFGYPLSIEPLRQVLMINTWLKDFTRNVGFR